MSKRTKVVLGVAVVVLLASAVVGFALLDDLPPLGERRTSQEKALMAARPGTEPVVPAPDSQLGQIQGQSSEIPPVPVPDLPQIGPRVIKTASLEVRVSEGKFGEQFTRAGEIAEQFGGFVTGSSTFDSRGEMRSGTIMVRIPSERFQEALAALKGLGKVTAEDQSGQDVTREFVDLEARLRHLRSQESFFLRLMGEARNVSDMIAIQQQLQNVQLQIEQLQGHLQWLNDQTSFATIAIRIFEAGAAPASPAPLGQAWQEALAGFQTVLGGFVIVAGWGLPFVLLGLAALLVWRLARTRLAM